MTGTFISRVMANAISESQGYARTNQYEVQLTPPPALQVQEAWMRRLSFNCFGAAITGSSLGAMTEEPGGMPRIITPTSPEYEPLTLNFYLSRDMMESAFFEAWHDNIYDKANGNLRYQNTYATDIMVNMKARTSDDVTTAAYRYVDAWPQSIGGVQLTYEATNQIASIPVTFVYRHKVLAGTKYDEYFKR